MNILISNCNDKPIYEQIYTQIRNQILSGALPPGQALPSIRALAKDLRVSVITTKRAYEELEKAGYLYTVPAKGSYVAGKKHPAGPGSLSDPDRGTHDGNSLPGRQLRFGGGGTASNVPPAV